MGEVRLVVGGAPPAGSAYERGFFFNPTLIDGADDAVAYEKPEPGFEARTPSPPLLYDLSSTYFEADPPFPEGDKRRHGYSRDHRPDCVQVVIAGQHLRQDDAEGLSGTHRSPVRQGRACLADGSRRAHRRDSFAHAHR